MTNIKKRLIYFAIAVLCFGICATIVVFFNGNTFIRGFLGDVIVVMLIYFLLRSIGIFKSKSTAIIVLTIAFGTEFLQYINITDMLGLKDNQIAKLVMGSVFDPMDLLAYTIGVIIVCIIDRKTYINLS